MSTDVVVVIGVGGIAQAIARRQGFGKLLLLADFNEDTPKAAATGLETTGYRVATARVDVSSRDSVRFLAPAGITNSGIAYGISKRANHLRVQAASLTWGERGARVNSISQIDANRDLSTSLAFD
jgi:NAD(P)-dependent dehydrogenase (short-subunit alcohol dehydrogenase family)